MAKNGGSLRVLVVEDDVPIGRMLASILADEGYVVDLASDGLTALGKIEAREYDLILTDLRMPELDGVGLYRELERRRPEVLRRVIVITGTSGHPEYQSFLEETKVPYLEKPFSLQALQTITRRVLAAA
jgi:two-component system NtrC family sensor kinase